jgi:MATE family multidrug resistance protein
LFTGIVSAVSPLAAQAYGSKNQKKVGTIARLGLGISLILAIPIALLFYNGGSLLLLLGQDANTAALAQTYLRAIALGFIPALGFAVLKSFLSALLQPRLVMVTVVLGTLLNIAANYVLMFGKLGFPAMGLAGIGWASTFSLVFTLQQAIFRLWTAFEILAIDFHIVPLVPYLH